MMINRIGAATMCLLAIAPCGAGAMDSCRGQWSAAALSPLPQPTVAPVALFGSSTANSQLAQAFAQGLNGGGLATGGAANVRLSVSYSTMGGGGGGLGRTRDSYDQWGAQNQWAGMAGGVSIEMPGMPRFGAAPGPTPQTLMLRAELRAMATGLPLWIATMQCQVQTADPQRLATDIGTLIGQSAGKEIAQTAM